MLKQFAVIGALALVPLSAMASQLPDYPFIHTSGVGSTYSMPDIGSIDFEVSAADANPEAARVIVESRIEEVRKLAEEQGVPADDIQTRDVRKEIRKGDPTATVAIYEIKCVVHMNVRDLSKWRAIAGPLLDMQNLDGFSTEFSSSEKERIETELTAVAIKDAKRRAEAIAAGFGRKLGPVTAVTSGSLKNLGSSMGLVQSDFRSSGGQQRQVNRRDILSIELMKMAQPVDVIFRLK